MAAIDTVSPESAASLAIVSTPLTDPPDLGLKLTLKAVLWPAARVNGRFRPVIVRPEPETFACDTVTLALPELVSVPDIVWP